MTKINNTIIKIITTILIGCATITTAVADTKLPSNINSKYYWIGKTNSNEPIYSSNSNDIRPIASITKLMTAIIIVESNQNLEEIITITDEDVDIVKNSKSRLKVGTTLTLKEALHLALMSSENRAAHALARTYPKGIDSFIREMNKKAISLGLKSTTFIDSTGLDPRNTSTAQELAIIINKASEYEIIRNLSTDSTFLFNNLEYNNSNKLIKDSKWNILTTKTGFTNEAGKCLAFISKINNIYWTIIILNSSSSQNRIKDAIKIQNIIHIHN